MTGDKLSWFFCLNENREGVFMDMARVAVLSSLPYELNKYCLYDGDNTDFISFLEKNGVVVIHRRVSVYDLILEVAKGGAYKTYAGAYLRTDIPLVIKSLGIKASKYLYTDCDIVFLRDPNECFFSNPKTISSTGECCRNDRSYFNSGVMLCNTEYMIDTYEEFISFIKEKKLDFKAFDQGALNEFYKEWDSLEDESNWKPYWGVNKNAYLTHWHGPKPHHVKMWMNSGLNVSLNNELSPYRGFLNENNFVSYKTHLAEYNKYLRMTFKD